MLKAITHSGKGLHFSALRLIYNAPGLIMRLISKPSSVCSAKATDPPTLQSEWNRDSNFIRLWLVITFETESLAIAQCECLYIAQSISRKRCSWQVARRIQGGHAHWLPHSSLVCREVKTLPVSVLRVPARLRFSFPQGSWKVGVCCTVTLFKINASD